MEREKDGEVNWFTQEQNPEPCAQVDNPNQEDLPDKWKWDVRYKHYKRLPKPYFVIYAHQKLLVMLIYSDANLEMENILSYGH